MNVKLTIEQIQEVLTRHNLLQEVFGFLTEGVVLRGFKVKSSEVEHGDVFICIRGFSSDGHAFAADAVSRGAAALVTETFLAQPVPQFRVSDARQAAAVLARLQFDDPTSHLTLLGVTGTNGKTTFTLLVEHILRECGFATGMIGTLGHSIKGKFHASDRTTPDIFDLNAIFRRMIDEGVTHVVMEVSSHAIALHRIYGLHFRTIAFTNLTRDHLDFHKTMQEYAAVKYRVFEYLAEENGAALFNLDDAAGSAFYDRYPGKSRGVSFDRGDLPVTDVELERDGSRFKLAGEPYAIRLIGRHNVQNAALAVAAVRESTDLTPEAINASLQTFLRAPGRLDAVPNELGIGLYVDYGHTDDALLHVLSSLHELPHHRLYCVFGAGGDRDRGKRPLMAKAALIHADLSIVTTDNPRSEDPDDIIRDILAESDIEDPWWIISDRRQAIRSAVRMTRVDDLVLLAGKGHETYQEIKGEKTHFDDREEAAWALRQPRMCIPGAPGSATVPVSIPIDPLTLEILYKQPRPKVNDCFRYVSTDTRTLSPYSLYFALAGEHFDGHDFLDRAFHYQTVGVVTHKPVDHPRAILVEDTTQAYLKLARKYLSLFPIKRIAVTGSVGKTSAKEMLFNVLSEAGVAGKSHANENNRIGLCKTIFRLDSEQDWGIFELGTNHPGEIVEMAQLLRPDISLITTVGASHLEFFKTVEGVFSEKTALFDHTSGLKVFPGDNPLFKGCKIEGGVSFGMDPSNDFHPEKLRPTPGGFAFKVRGEEFHLPTDIPHQVHNALGIIALCMTMGVSSEAIRNGLAQSLSPSMRLEVRVMGDRLVIVDCYNANPDSMRAAISYWAGLHPERPHAAILGDMLELGPTAPSMHRGVGQHLRSVVPRISSLRLAGVGALSAFFSPDVRFETVESLLESDWIPTLPSEAVVLIKASHGVRLEKTIPAFQPARTENVVQG
jgi:UDP-N-acetylmuramyl-tripeptide synthetase/UDP-N-acetylmuramoyl-tripeptide--D-alanyl-D-alanine ligase